MLGQSRAGAETRETAADDDYVEINAQCKTLNARGTSRLSNPAA